MDLRFLLTLLPLLMLACNPDDTPADDDDSAADDDDVSDDDDATVEYEGTFSFDNEDDLAVGLYGPQLFTAAIYLDIYGYADAIAWDCPEITYLDEEEREYSLAGPCTSSGTYEWDGSMETLRPTETTWSFDFADFSWVVEDPMFISASGPMLFDQVEASTDDGEMMTRTYSTDGLELSTSAPIYPWNGQSWSPPSAAFSYTDIELVAEGNWGPAGELLGIETWVSGIVNLEGRGDFHAEGHWWMDAGAWEQTSGQLVLQGAQTLTFTFDGEDGEDYLIPYEIDDGRSGSANVDGYILGLFM